MMEDIRTRVPRLNWSCCRRPRTSSRSSGPEALNRHLAAFLDDLTGAKAVRAGGVSFEAGLANRKSVLGVEHHGALAEERGRFRDALATF